MQAPISITEAAMRGIARVRLPVWANPLDHIKIDITRDGGVGPWLHLFCPINKAINGRDPVDFLWMVDPMKTDIHAREFEPYSGPLPGSEEYQKAAE